MTDGIIQETFKKYFIQYHTFKDMYVIHKDYIDLSDLDKIERELIANIKQWANHNGLDLQAETLYNYLIGDAK